MWCPLSIGNSYGFGITPESVVRSALFVFGGRFALITLWLCVWIYNKYMMCAPHHPSTHTPPHHHHTNSGFLFLLHPERDAYQTTTHQVRSGVSSQVLPASALLFASARNRHLYPLGFAAQQIMRMHPSIHQLMRVWCGVVCAGAWVLFGGWSGGFDVHQNE